MLLKCKLIDGKMTHRLLLQGHQLLIGQTLKRIKSIMEIFQDMMSSMKIFEFRLTQKLFGSMTFTSINGTEDSRRIYIWCVQFWNALLQIPIQQLIEIMSLLGMERSRLTTLMQLFDMELMRYQFMNLLQKFEIMILTKRRQLQSN